MRKSFIERAAEIEGKIVELDSSLGSIPTEIDNFLIPDEIFDFFFDLQKQIESEGKMDYYEYARRLWRHFFPGRKMEGQIYDQFQSELIIGLHRIEMKALIYDHVDNNLDQLVEKLYTRLRKIILWSTGDTESTGYQVRKIERSRIIRKFLRALKPIIPDRKERYESIDEKTEYFVADDKIELLANHLEIEDVSKLVVIEDSLSNLSKVQKVADTVGVDFVPVWTLYSRSAIEMKNRDPYKYENCKRNNNGINSFDEILHLDGLTGVDLVIDFDGVLSDHVKMRNLQAQVKWNAIKKAGY